MPPSRQKSCLACVQSKRKCDKGLPKCQRCLAKKTDCEYNSQYPDRPRQTTRRNVDENVAIAEPFAEEPSSDGQLQRSRGLPSAAILSPRTNDAFFNFGNNPFNLASIPPDDFLSSALIDDIVARQNSTDIVQMISDTTPQARVEFVAKRLAVIPKTFSESGQTMFIHRLLFQARSPTALQDALSVCALYSLKTAENQLLVFRNLEHRRQQLIANTDPLLASKMNLLEALQALILYQIIRLFDGDIRLRAQAEADEPVLIMWAAQLRLRTHQVQPSPSAPAEARPPPGSSFTDWQHWLIEESSRRTVITAFMLKGVYQFLKLGCDTVPDMQMSFTAQVALWNSLSEISWRKAYSERERLEVWVTHWDEAIAKAKPGDLEELGVLIMAMLKGLEATGEWLGHTHFIRYGLEGARNGSI
ncbi:transcription factor gsfR2 [Penicillium sp. CMV-2018d]|nr:transcription factor gsfR2 [Penicillium sp. CMV-2018d]